MKPDNQRGIMGEVLPVAGGIGGAAIGAMLGAPLGPAGIGAGGVAGAGVGGAAGEYAQQKIEQIAGDRASTSPGQVLASGALSMAGEGLGKVAFTAGKLAVNAIRPKMVGFIAKLSGYSDDLVQRAMERTSGAVGAVTSGEKVLNDVVRSSAKKVNELAKNTLDESSKKISELSKLSGGGKGFPGTRQALLEEGSNFIANISKNLRANYNIGVEGQSKLLFDRSSLPSNIVSGGDSAAIQNAFTNVKKIQNDTTIENIDAVLERLITLQKKTPAGSPTGAETKAIIRDMYDEVVRFSASLSKYGPGYTGYAEFLKENLPKRVLINDAKDIFGSTANMSDQEVSQVATRLLRMFNTGKLAEREGIEKVGAAVGTDPVGATAGTLMDAGDNISIRAQNLTKRGIAEKVLEAVPRALIKEYVSTGNVVDLASHPVLSFAATTLGISAKALAQEVINLSSNKTSSDGQAQ